MLINATGFKTTLRKEAIHRLHSELKSMDGYCAQYFFFSGDSGATSGIGLGDFSGAISGTGLGVFCGATSGIGLISGATSGIGLISGATSGIGFISGAISGMGLISGATSGIGLISGLPVCAVSGVLMDDSPKVYEAQDRLKLF